MIAVTGLDLTGQSVLYLVDTQEMQLACYQATGGAGGTQGVRLVNLKEGDKLVSLEVVSEADLEKYAAEARERPVATTPVADDAAEAGEDDDEVDETREEE